MEAESNTFLKNKICSKIKLNRIFSIKKGKVSHTVPGAHKKRNNNNRLDISQLNKIIKIDPIKRICIAEAAVTFTDLVSETLKYHLVPKCVPELKQITIGGAVSGFSLESMSYKYGCLHDSCLEYEVITGSGKVIICSEERNSDIFHMLNHSYGTLGVITKITLELIPSLPYVKMDYYKYSSVEQFLDAIHHHYLYNDVDFMDGIIHNQNELILCLGTFVPATPYTNSYYHKIFYKSTRTRKEDYLKTYDYFFRYDADCHWITRNYGLENPVLRKMFGHALLGSENLLNYGKKINFFLKGKAPDVIVDLIIPYKNTPDFIKWYQNTFHFYPLWVVPFTFPKKLYPWIHPEYLKDIDNKLFIDFAIYGLPQQRRSENYYKIIENKVMQLKGFKGLISHNYYDEEDFWNTYNKSQYYSIKNQIDPHGSFLDLYTKFH